MRIAIGMGVGMQQRAVVPDVTAPVISSAGFNDTTDTISAEVDEAGTLYWVMDASITPPTAAQVKLGQGADGVAADLSGTFAVTGGGNSSNADVSGLADGTYYLYIMVEDAAGNQSAVSATTISVTNPVAYTQNFVDSNAAATWSATAPAGDGAALTFSAWVKPLSLTNAIRIFAISGRSFVDITTAGKLSVSIVDSANVVGYASESVSALFSANVLAHIYVSANFATNTLVIEVNGATVSMVVDPATFTGGTGLTDLDRSPLIAPAAYTGQDFQVSDWALWNSVQANTAIYNGGTPPDPTGFATQPLILLGGDMTADERGGNTAQGWNDGYHLGSAVVTVTTSGWIDGV